MDNHTFTVLGQYRIISWILGRAPTMTEFVNHSDYSRAGYHRLRRVYPEQLTQDQSQEEEALMRQLYSVLKNKYEN